jgi:hypothetical protein
MQRSTRCLVAASYSVINAKEANKVDPLCSMCWNNLGSGSWSRVNFRRLEWVRLAAARECVGVLATVREASEGPRRGSGFAVARTRGDQHGTKFHVRESALSHSIESGGTGHGCIAFRLAQIV